MPCPGQRAVVVHQRVVHCAQRMTGGTPVDLTTRRDVAPERDDMPIAPVWPRIELVDGRHDRRTQTRGVRRDGELPYDVSWLRSSRQHETGRDARDDRKRWKVHEDMPCLPQHDGILAMHALRLRGGECSGDSAL
jgi:hypothetical protein